MFMKLLAVAGFVSLASVSYAQTIELRFATSVASVDEPSFKAMEAFAQRVEERAGGRLKLSLFPGEQLGAQKKVNEMIKGGASMMNMTDYGQLGQFSPDMGILAGPYIYGSLDDAQRMFKSDVFEEMSDRLAAEGITIIMPNGLFGYRHLISDKAVRTPADLANMTVRVPPSPIMLEAFRALGARPTEIAWGEVYNALQTNVVNAAEAPFASIYGSKLNEVRKVISMTSHQILFTSWVTSTTFFDSLPSDLQQILKEEGAKVADELTAATLQSDGEYRAKLVDAGVEIVEDVDIPAFQKASSIAYAAVPNLTPGIVDRIRGAMAAN
jgi:tripartite ATP-independent transporter DctP family solute receptor